MTLVPLPERLSHLLASLCDATITNAEFEELQDCLMADDDARLAYVRYISLHANLLTILPATASAELPSPQPADHELEAAQALLQDVWYRATVADELATVAAAASSEPPSPDRRFSLQTTLLAFAAVAAVFYGAFAAISWNLRPDVAPPVLERPFHEAPAVALIQDADRAVWASKPTAGESFQMALGVIEQTLGQGATVVVEGPAEWSVADNNRVTLKHGRLLATVPEQAVGFTVSTPTATVIDLGTEFGVTVDAHGGTHTRVFRGEVKLQAASPEAVSSAPSAARRPVEHRLSAGQAVRVDLAGNVTTVEPEYATAEAFIRHPGTSPHESDPAGAYSRAVLDTEGLVGYWRLAEADPGKAYDEVSLTDADRAALPVKRLTPARSAAAGRSPGQYREFWMADFRRPGALPGDRNCAVHFNGESYVEVEDHPSLSGDWDGLTLAAWIKPDRNPPAGSDATALIVGKWAFETSGDAYVLLYERPGTIRLAVGNGKQGENGLRGTGTVPITADAYHFVAGTWDKATGAYRLYVDGQADAAQGKQQAPWQTNPKSYVPVFIGGQRATNNRYFAGTIDEVCIFNRALTAEEIKNLYEQATPKSQPGETPAVNPIDQR